MKWHAVLFFCVAVLVNAFIVKSAADNSRWDKYDASWQLKAARSIYYDGDLDIKNQLQFRPEWAWDQTAAGKNGQWYPIHEILMPILSVPFYALFGEAGFRLTAAINCALLELFMLLLCQRHVGRVTAYAAVILTSAFSAIFPFGKTFSLDVFAAWLLLIPYLYALEARPLAAGLSFGAAVYGRFANVAALPALVFLLIKRKMSDRSYGQLIDRFVLGGIPALSVLCLDNYLRFGSPLTTSYQRWQVFHDGRFVMLDQLEVGFSRSLDIALKFFFFSDVSGLLATMPLLPLVVVGLLLLWRKAADECWFFVLAFFGYALLTIKYIGVPSVYGDPEFYGNRYLLPVVALSSVPLALALESLAKFVGDSLRPRRIR